jgi:copper chaperone CopZ
MEAQKVGIVSAIIASICCIGPLALILLGLGGLGLGAFFSKFHWIFIGAGAVVLLVAWVLHFREKRRCATEYCQMRNKKFSMITLAIATAAVVFFAGANLYTYAGGVPVINSVGESSEDTGIGNGLSRMTIPVEGMTCFTCEISVEQAAKKLDEVWKAEADVKNNSLTVDYNPNQVTIAEIVREVNKTDYRAHIPKK